MVLLNTTIQCLRLMLRVAEYGGNIPCQQNLIGPFCIQSFAPPSIFMCSKAAFSACISTCARYLKSCLAMYSSSHTL
jgi:hypothetical protein